MALIHDATTPGNWGGGYHIYIYICMYTYVDTARVYTNAKTYTCTDVQVYSEPCRRGLHSDQSCCRSGLRGQDFLGLCGRLGLRACETAPGTARERDRTRRMDGWCTEVAL